MLYNESSKSPKINKAEKEFRWYKNPHSVDAYNICFPFIFIYRELAWS